MSLNINGIRGKKLELQSLLDVEKPDIVAIQETKIDGSVCSRELIPEDCGYSVYRNDRTLHGGGVLLLVKSDIQQMPVDELTNGSESVWVRTIINGVSHYFGSWYRPPDQSCDDFMLFNDQLTKIRSFSNGGKVPMVHVMGDFNFKNINWSTGLNKSGAPLNNSDGQMLIDIMNDHGLEQLVNFPTREQNTLDLLLTSLPNLFENVHSQDKLSDHEVISAHFKVSAPPRKSQRRKCYLYNKGDYNSMRQETLSFAKNKYFNGHANSRSVEENWGTIKSFLKDLVDKYIPSKMTRSTQSLPWVTGKIRKLIRKRNKTHAKAKRTGSDRLLARWKKLRKTVKDEIHTAHENYVNNLIGDIKKDPKSFWRYINGQKKDAQGIPPLKRKNNNLAQTDEAKAEALNEQFSGVFTKFDETSVPLLGTQFPKMGDINVSEAGIIKLLKGLNPSKASGPDGINPRVLKELSTELGPLLTHLFQQSLDKGEIPKDWSMANICPLYKKGDRALASNYRPVSLTCICSKLLEHVVCSNIMGHLDEYSILSDRQHAFRKFHSCETQLCTVIDDWSKNLDRGERVDIFIMDLEKAFDTPPHELLKAKLYRYGIRGKTLNWIDSFLCFRSQCVVVNGTKSGWSSVVSGVPQGTVLGPILFSLYINDMITDIQSEIRLFADDCVCYRPIHSENDRKILQSDIDKLGKWARKWGMRFQPVKCNMMTLSRKRVTKNHTTYSLEGSILETVSSIKYLGVTITSDLKWNKHVGNICLKASRSLGLLRRNLGKCPQNVKETAYKGLVRPILEYAGCVWDPSCVNLQQELEKVQSRAARFVTSNYNYDPGSMTAIMNQLKWKPLKVRRKDSRLILLYKGLNGEAKIPIDDLVKPSRKCKSHHDMSFRIPYARTECYKSSFIPNTIRDWNSLPAQVIASAESAKDKVNTFILKVKSD